MGFIVFAIFIILFDQASKFYIQHSMQIGESIPVIEGIFHITYVENLRTSFGLFEYNSSFFVIAVVISVILVILIYKKIIFKKDAQLAKKEAQLAKKEAQLAEKDKIIEELQKKI